MKVRADGCVTCGATWGDYWEEVGGQRMFFCCDVCAAEFKNLVKGVKDRTGWNEIDEIQMEGSYRGRLCSARRLDGSYEFFVRFGDDGGVLSFVEAP
jgi:hypothetical protein